MCLVFVKVFFFYGNCFYLYKREYVLFLLESVFEKFFVMFLWLLEEGFGVKIICVIE